MASLSGKNRFWRFGVVEVASLSGKDRFSKEFSLLLRRGQEKSGLR